MNACTMLASALLALAAVAQTGAQVTGRGERRVEVMPTTLRFAVALQGKGDTLEAALADVQTKADDLTQKLAELKPTEGTLVTQGPFMAAAGGAVESARLLQVERRRFGEDMEGTPKVALTTMVRAEWPVPPGDMRAVLREEDRVRQALMKALPEGVAPAEVNQISGEALLAMMTQALGGEAAPARPQLLFVARLPDEILAEARHEAFLKAKQDAQAISEAAGAALGPLKTLESHAAAGDEQNPELRRTRMRMMGISEQQDEDGERVAVSPVLRPAVFVVTVSATFELMGAK